ncbi:MAG: hypothetical protein LBI27_01430 [Clostridiales bacterium]|jgi:hypothetical protein|nr:hypothetical protein [Clostridiales bacterium]
MFGTTLIAIGTLGIFAWVVAAFTDDPPESFDAKVARVRLDTKKYDGKEKYTYIITFFIPSLNKNLSFKVSQSHFDEMVPNDCGILTCNIKRRKIISWEYRQPKP